MSVLGPTVAVREGPRGHKAVWDLRADRNVAMSKISRY